MFLALTLFFGCEEPTPTPDPATPTPAFVPTAGSWTIDTYDVLNDVCGLASEDLDLTSVGFEIQDASAAGFLLDIDVDLMADCALEGNDFDCGAMVLRQDLNPDVDATFVLTFVSSGTFADAGSFDAVQVVNIDCEGPECDDVDEFLGATLPCDVDYDMRATAD